MILLALIAASGATFGQNGEQVWLDSLEAYWSKLNTEFKDPEHSPLPPEAREHFTVLDRFAPDPAFRVVAKVKRKAGKPFAMKTSTDRLPMYEPVAVLSFKLNGKKLRLTVYRNIDLSKKAEYVNYLFIPFTDSTNGTSTYGGGRYLELQGPLAEAVELDFNRAYNPYCAYGGRYSCPVPPAENHLPVAIEAGVKAFEH
ncbi:MAG TPA: DUF1684 domain-containing protein [Flavobacteriales bacterium]|nr:DUF1684 domain-containing protein [Flavobacteriales bacterium]